VFIFWEWMGRIILSPTPYVRTHLTCRVASVLPTAGEACFKMYQTRVSVSMYTLQTAYALQTSSSPPQELKTTSEPPPQGFLLACQQLLSDAYVPGVPSHLRVMLRPHSLHCPLADGGPGQCASKRVSCTSVSVAESPHSKKIYCPRSVTEFYGGIVFIRGQTRVLWGNRFFPLYQARKYVLTSWYCNSLIHSVIPSVPRGIIFY
jgi:hypothetical protein